MRFIPTLVPVEPQSLRSDSQVIAFLLEFHFLENGLELYTIE